MRSDSCKRAGMSFVEVLIAVALLMIGMAALFSLSSHMLRMNSLASNMSTATAVGQSRMELLQATHYTNLTAGSEAINEFAIGWTVSTNDSPNYKRILVKVGWTDIDNKNHEVKLKGLVAE